MASDATLRDTMNQGEANRLPDLDRDVQVGELANALLIAMTATESGVSVTSNVATLAATPKALWDCNATTATTTGHKKLRKVSNAFLTANNPAAGECFWDGGTKVKFASADVVTVAAFKYSQAADATCSYLQRTLGQIDG